MGLSSQPKVSLSFFFIFFYHQPPAVTCHFDFCQRKKGLKWWILWCDNEKPGNREWNIDHSQPPRPLCTPAFSFKALQNANKIFSTTLVVGSLFTLFQKSPCLCPKEVKFCCHPTNNTDLDVGCPGAFNCGWTYLWGLKNRSTSSLVTLTRGLSVACCRIGTMPSRRYVFFFRPPCFSLLRLISFLADWDTHFGCRNTGNSLHYVFLSASVFDGTALLRRLLLREQFVTGAAPGLLRQELLPSLRWEISSETWREEEKNGQDSQVWRLVIESTETISMAPPPSGYDHHPPGWCVPEEKQRRVIPRHRCAAPPPRSS